MVRSGSPEAQRVLGADKVRSEDYTQLARIASKLSPAQWADYAARVTARTTDLDQLERSVEAYLRQAEQRAAQAEKYENVHTKLLGTESLLKQYREYQKKQKVATEGTTITIVGAAGGGHRPHPAHPGRRR
jgi:tRNA U34 5-carboxymethylaminomethyl modifying GTPase MnmE/TrmE